MAPMTDVDLAALRTLLAEREIRQVLHTYCHAIDREDWTLLRSIYFNDAWEDHVHYKGRGVDFGDYIRPSLRARGYRAGAHHITSTYVDLRGPTDALVESYFIALGNIRTEEIDRLHVMSGRYVDRFERRASRWLIADRRVAVDIDTLLDREGAYAMDQLSIVGRPAPDDIATGIVRLR